MFKSKWSVVLEKLNFLTNKTLRIMETLDTLTARVTKITGDLSTIKTNVAAIRASLPASGGLSQADVDTLASSLDGAVAASDAEVVDTAAPAPAPAPVTDAPAS